MDEELSSPFGLAQQEKGGILRAGARTSQTSIENETMDFGSGRGELRVLGVAGEGRVGGGGEGGGRGEGSDPDDGRAWGGADGVGEDMGLTTLFGSEGLKLAGSGGIRDAIGHGRRKEENAFLEVWANQHVHLFANLRLFIRV